MRTNRDFGAGKQSQFGCYTAETAECAEVLVCVETCVAIAALRLDNQKCSCLSVLRVLCG
jgi:hypothetical protein